MRNKQLDSDEFNYQVELEDGGAIARRKTELLRDGSYFFEDELEVKGVLTPKIIMCAAWLFEIYELKAGEIFFIKGSEEIRPRSKRFGFFYPPFSISQPRIKDAKANLRGIAATEISDEELIPKTPVMFETDFADLSAGVKKVKEILKTVQNCQSIEINPNPSPLSLRAKTLIDENYLIYPSIARIAARLNVSHEHLTRQFKHDFGLTPSAYLHQIRISDATFKLAKGEEIINVSHEVGYNDLSRFYKQFRKNTQASPGDCRLLLNQKRTK